jgi:hypothetical protein
MLRRLERFLDGTALTMVDSRFDLLLTPQFLTLLRKVATPDIAPAWSGGTTEDRAVALADALDVGGRNPSGRPAVLVC